MIRKVQLLVSLLLFLFLLPAFIIVASAATFRVNSTDDIKDVNPGDGVCWTGNLNTLGECTLRAAVMEANAILLWPGNSHEINIGPGIFTLTLAGDDDTAHAGDLDITKPMIIKGAGSAQTIINGNKIDRIFEIHGSPGADYTITHQTTIVLLAPTDMTER